MQSYDSARQFPSPPLPKESCFFFFFLFIAGRAYWGRGSVCQEPIIRRRESLAFWPGYIGWRAGTTTRSRSILNPHRLLQNSSTAMCSSNLSPYTEQNTDSHNTINLAQCDCLYPCPFHITVTSLFHGNTTVFAMWQVCGVVTVCSQCVGLVICERLLF